MSVELRRRWVSEAVERRAPTTAFVEALSELMDGDERVICVTADLARSAGVEALDEAYPGRVFNVGGSTTSAVGLAAGLAAQGMVPVVIIHGKAAPRAADLLRTMVAHDGLHVVIAGHHGGLAGTAGAAGHVLHDIATLTALPSFRVLIPTDAEETAKALITLVDNPGPGYVRLSTEPLPVVTGPDSPFDLGAPSVLREGSDVGLVASGALVFEALCAADLLEDAGQSARVLAIHTLSPFEPALLEALARELGALVVAEEHAPAGGLGAVCAQALAQESVAFEHLHAGSKPVGAASNPTLRSALGLDREAIVAAAGRAVARKS